MAFATHADLATRLGVDLTSSEQTDATALIALAQALIQSETGQDIELVEGDTLTRPGVWGDRIRLPERPVVAVNSVTVDGTELDSDDWYLDGDEIVRAGFAGVGISEQSFTFSGRGWGGPEAEIVVDYDHGWETIPGTVKAVCLEMCVRVWTNPGSVKQEGYGSEQVSYADVGLMLTDRELSAVSRAVRRTAGTTTLR